MDDQQASFYKRNIQHRGDINHPKFPHGTYGGWKAGCKCDNCVEGAKKYKRDYNRNLRATNEKYRIAQSEDKKRFRKTDRGKALYNSMTALHRQRKIQQTPINCNHDLLRLIYENCPDGYHVDHIIPISLGGLHEPNNLQYLTKEENLKKSNSLNYNYTNNCIKWQSLIEEASTTRN